ncbi:multiheme c-type cytochrome [Gayadomonas joobiniege]|uniref:multiheme c-type cytochrome n=1 Tax=Gayadomonas joobiniege TaxID=1234606 RepID=UPI00036FAE80|nr:multiheme c-type cytochrome [Gayadomonas joobiniege]
MSRSLLFVVLSLLLSSFSIAAENSSMQACISCHSDIHQGWQSSDHAKAMAVADESSVVADFDNAKLNYFSQTVEFFKQSGKYKARISEQGKPNKEYQLSYTFGHYPLQQFLVEGENGKKQVFPFTWDSRNKEDGGQKWYHLHGHEWIAEQDRLHWQQPLQNWNGMCADCHSDELKRNYNAVTDSFETEYSNINVGCVSCHAMPKNHSEEVEQSNYKKPAAAKGNWVKNPHEKIAHWQGQPRDNTFMDNCFACHALRSPLTDGFSADKPFLDQFMPEFLMPPLYHADGQIKEEVYVYGSFMQSKMHQAGVNCIDCHDPHSYKVKTETNGLCLQCHEAKTFDTKDHHHHLPASEGAQCVNCHMPETTYMGVDDRRDHSFVIPRPELSEKFGVPNACTQCHQQQDNQWAMAALKSWNGKQPDVSGALKSYMLQHSGELLGAKQHYQLINDEHLDIMKRATLVRMLAWRNEPLALDKFSSLLKSDEALIRLAAAQVANLIAPEKRYQLLKPLLDDEFKAIRVATAQALLDVYADVKDAGLFKKAFDAYQTFADVNSWRAEGRLNKGNGEMRMQALDDAVDSFRKTIQIEPYFDAGYINLADLYRARQQPQKVAEVLKKGLANLPESASLNYSYGLYLVRQKSYQNALNFIEKANKAEPGNMQYLYTRALLMDNLQQSKAALKLLLADTGMIKTHGELKELALYLAQKLNDRFVFQRLQSL